MSDSRWNRIDALFHAALEHAPAERARFLETACAEDPSLVAEVQALLAADATTDDRVGQAVADAARSIGDTTDDASLGRVVGPFRLVRVLGRGGMGVVYLAERADGLFEQRVALKLIRAGQASEAVRARFAQERQILAGLQHPGIARLIDGGVTADGQPWYAMEHVEGTRLDRWCEQRGASVEERLHLFEAACAAVAYAHARLVVHRDLKPEHMLVTATGEVRLLDFGIAKVLVGDDVPADQLAPPGADPWLTGALRGALPMTPAYASPEQVRGEPVGTATDVYALGVVLYELLTGARPYEVSDGTPEAMVRAVCHTTPPAPSVRVTQVGAPHGARRALERRLSGDLDAICLKALKKDPSQRYATVDALREDLRRHRAALPVLARPDTLGYRLRTRLRRHPTAVVAVAAALLFAVSLTAVYTRRLAEERDVARREATRATEVAAFLRTLFAVSDPATVRGDTITARTLLDAGATRVDSALAGDPVLRAELTWLIGDVYLGLGLADRARPLLERARDLRVQALGPTHPDVATSTQSLATALQDLGDVEGALPLFRAVVAARRRAPDGDAQATAESLLGLGFALETVGEEDSALQLYREARAVVQRALPAEHPRRAYSDARLGGLLRRLGEHDEAEPLLRDALAAQRAALGPTHSAVASTTRNLAALLRDTRRYEEADSLYQVALAIRLGLHGELHPDVITTRNSYANLLQEMGAFDRAIAVYRQLDTLLPRLYASVHPTQAAVANNLAVSLRDAGRLGEAAAAFRRSITLGAQVLPEGHRNLAYPLVGLAGVLAAQQRPAAAEPLLRRALAIRQAALAPGHREVGEVFSELGAVLTAQRRYAEAELVLLQADTILRATERADSRRLRQLSERTQELYARWPRPDSLRRLGRATP